MIRALLILLFLAFNLSLFAQRKELIIKGIDNVKLDIPLYANDSMDLLKKTKLILSQLYEQSYLSATTDSIHSTKDSYIVYFSPGLLYKWISLSPGNLSESELEQIDLSNRLFLNRPFNAKQLIGLFQRTIGYFENNGYPFASVRLDSFHIYDQHLLSASLHIERNQFYKIDSIIMKGNPGIKRRYLLNYLGLEPGQPFNEKKINEISIRIQEIPFIKEKSKHEVQYFENGVKIILNVENKKASRFDGILGLLTNETDGKVELTGDVDLNLINSFRRGESIELNWRKLKGNSQDLQMGVAYPYFLNSPFGIDFDFKLFKRDTTFIDLISRMGINYTFKRGEIITLFVENKSSNLLSKNALIATSTTIPNIGDVTVNSFGISYELKQLDYLYNPTKGVSIASSFAVGNKRLKKIKALEEERPSIYNGIDLVTTQFQGLFSFNYFIPFGNRSTILLGNQSATVYSSNLYQNELLRIGGLKILRGFDEESINVSSYSVFTMEYRFLLDRNSYFSLFTDGAYYENNNVDSYESDTPLGIGAGISFETAAGIFTFNYAVGKQFDNPIQFQAAKIHFGFVNFF